MRADAALNDGDTAITIGFYSNVDGGGAVYSISNIGTENNVTVFRLSNGKYATTAETNELIVEKYGINDANTARPEWALSNSEILNSLLKSHKTFIFGNKEYEFDSSIEFNSGVRNITFNGNNTTIIFVGTGTFIADDKSRYIYFNHITFTTDQSSNYDKDFFKTKSRNTYDFFFNDCIFTRFRIVIEYEGLSWDGIINDCIFRSNGTAFKLNTAGTTFTVFNNCIIENCKDTYIDIAGDDIGANVHFNNCMIEGTEPSTGRLVSIDSEDADITFSNCYFEVSSPTQAVYFVYSYKADNVRFLGQSRITSNGILCIKNAIDLDCLNRAIAQNIFAYNPVKRYATMWAEQMRIPFVAHSEILDTLPHVSGKQYGNSLNLSATRLSGNYEGNTTRTDVVWHSEFYNNKKLRGRCFCIEYAINDLEELKTSENTFSLRCVMYNDSGNAIETITPSLYGTWRKTILSVFTDASLKLYMFVPISRNDVNSINFYSLRADNRLKATDIYIL